MDTLKVVDLYSIAVCPIKFNTGGFAILLKYNDHIKAISSGFRVTTLKRMQLMAIIVGLRRIKYSCAVNIFTDWSYLANEMSNGRMRKLSNRGWRNRAGKKLDHIDLWTQLLTLDNIHKINYITMNNLVINKELETCRTLAATATESKILLRDQAFELHLGFRKSLRSRSKISIFNDKGYNSSEETQWVYDSKEEAYYIAADYE